MGVRWHETVGGEIGAKEVELMVVHNAVEELFTLRPRLEQLYDILGANGQCPFTGESTKSILDKVWEKNKRTARVEKNQAERVRDVVHGREKLPVRMLLYQGVTRTDI
jgi:hypothetical protein